MKQKSTHGKPQIEMFDGHVTKGIKELLKESPNV